MNKSIKVVIFATLVACWFSVSAVHIGATVSTKGDTVNWEAVFEMSSEQMRFARQTADELTSTMRANDITAHITEGQLALSGVKSIEQARIALFDVAAKWADFLGGPVELTLTLPVGQSSVTLRLEARMTTGYRWDVFSEASTGGYSQVGQSTFSPRYRGIGAPYIQTIELKSSDAENSKARLIYRRPFQKDAPMKARLAISVTNVSGVIELSDPTPAEPKSNGSISESADADPFSEFKDRALPTSWDWRIQDPEIIPTVRDQGPCGSCWAFGTVGVMESALKKGGGPMTDLSEQFLVSCNMDGWDCDGGWTANKYHHNTLGYSQTIVGAVLESEKPYTATNGSCSVAYNHPYKLDDWEFITGSEYTMPTNDQLKNAIYTYGPITAGVCADDGWNYYTGGVYVTTANICQGSTNHQIVLVGWDDATQSWILRNSWGPEWGENGYMRIQYDPAGTTSRVGEGTSWVKYQGAVAPPPPTLAPIHNLLLEKE